MRYCVMSGGKRFRPLLCLGGAEAVGGRARQALRAACAIELIHTYSLVHDDLPAMDDAPMRRGRPSCHRKFGEGNAILVGDALLTLAFELLGRNGTPNALGIVHTLGRGCGTAGLIGGQALDLDAMRRPRTATARLLREIARQKTAALITASVVIGGLAGGATAAQRARLERYGRHLGLAFQLVDDVHDGDGLAAALGPDAALDEARRLVDRALDEVEPFGARARALEELAGWLTTTA
jgi:geranylgeranyl diphosphate synthase type II